MNIESIQRTKSAVVSSEHCVSVAVTNENAAELRNALEVVDRYKKAAMQALTHKLKFNPEKDSDWCEVRFGVKNDRVLVYVESGMAG